MKFERTYMKCNICGNLIGMINDSGIVPECCGEPMHRLIANTVDAAQEKHLPDIKRNGNSIHITVGSVLHPMTQDHYIEWIVLAQETQTQHVALSPSDQPEAAFDCKPGPVTVYAYCNLHGLWASEQ